MTGKEKMLNTLEAIHNLINYELKNEDIDNLPEPIINNLQESFKELTLGVYTAIGYSVAKTK